MMFGLLCHAGSLAPEDDAGRGAAMDTEFERSTICRPFVGRTFSVGCTAEFGGDRPANDASSPEPSRWKKGDIFIEP